MNLPRLGLLASGRGSNLQAIIDACRAGDLGAVPAVAISNNAGAEALARARQAGIPAFHLSATTHPDPGALDRAIDDCLRRHRVDLVILAGYMKKLGPRTLGAFAGRVLNIHPALLPKFGGQGMYGRRIHEAVIAAGERETGITVHLADEEYDRGPILAQRRIPVLASDTAESLAARVLAEEHAFYVEVLRDVLAGRIKLPA
jgi:phosphoribosylglycinamide formyltransferase-1